MSRDWEEHEREQELAEMPPCERYGCTLTNARPIVTRLCWLYVAACTVCLTRHGGGVVFPVGLACERRWALDIVAHSLLDVAGPGVYESSAEGTVGE